jgi:FdhE protein
MQRTATGLRTDPASRVAELGRSHPEWRTWLELLAVASRQSPVARRVGSQVSGLRSSSDPLLHQATIEVDAGKITRLVQDLLSIAAGGELAGGTTLRGYRPSKPEAIEMVLAAVRQDADELGRLAQDANVDPGALASVAHLAAIPLLQQCGRELQEQVPGFWPHGYCPLCAAWPTLAERRGLDRTRRMRCGRCGGEWEMEWLCCVYCGERDHEKLGMLVPEESGETLKVETCESCRGYLKSVATLQAIPPFELLLRDLDTIELDLVARERGYGRPEEVGFRLELRAGS